MAPGHIINSVEINQSCQAAGRDALALPPTGPARPRRVRRGAQRGLTAVLTDSAPLASQHGNLASPSTARPLFRYELQNWTQLKATAKERSGR